MLKQSIKSVVPKRALVKYKDWHERQKLSFSFRQQRKQFSRYYSRPYSDDKYQIETQVLFGMHQIEKGLSHDVFRPGFGKNVLNNLSQLLTKLRHLDSQYSNNWVYLAAVRILHDYVSVHQNMHFDLGYAESMFSKDIWNEINAPLPERPSNLTVCAKDKEDNKKSTFKEIAERRHSVREYSTEKVTEAELNTAISLARRSPSVCNRQPVRVYEIFDKQKIQALLDIQGGYRGYATPPALILVTSDARAFMNSAERNEPFVDGGLFSMSILYALEYYGLAACPLNAMFSEKQEQLTRNILGVPDNEFMVMYISVGHFAEKTHTCHSPRFPLELITTTIK
jgi:nitroreductase